MAMLKQERSQIDKTLAPHPVYPARGALVGQLLFYGLFALGACIGTASFTVVLNEPFADWQVYRAESFRDLLIVSALLLLPMAAVLRLTLGAPAPRSHQPWRLVRGVLFVLSAVAVWYVQGLGNIAMPTVASDALRSYLPLLNTWAMGVMLVCGAIAAADVASDIWAARRRSRAGVPASVRSVEADCPDASR